MNKFKVGDRVRCCNNPCDNQRLSGKVGTVLNVSDDNIRISVEFDEYINGHSCIGLGEYGKCWNVYNWELEKINKVNWVINIKAVDDTTYGKLIENGKVVKEVSTKKHPDDKYDREVAVKTVVDRLFEPEYFNGKVVCVENSINGKHLRVGKIYEFKNGIGICENSIKITSSPVTSVKDLNSRFQTVKFVEVVE